MLHYLKYEHENSEEWVTFIHGAGGSSSIWFKQIREFSKHYNILLIDLRGHGQSKFALKKIIKRYTFPFITNDVVEVMDHLKIRKSHFVGISLGTIIVREIAELYPQRVSSMIMGGAIMKLNLRSQILMRIGVVFKSVIPYIFLYKFFAFIIMPRENHKESRILFIEEARKLYQKEFIRWFRLTAEINPLLRLFRAKDIPIPTLYLMGSEDHMFLPSIRRIVEKHQFAQLIVVPNCGHVVNIEQPSVFNTMSIDFIRLLNNS